MVITINISILSYPVHRVPVLLQKPPHSAQSHPAGRSLDDDDDDDDQQLTEAKKEKKKISGSQCNGHLRISINAGGDTGKGDGAQVVFLNQDFVNICSLV